MHRSVLETLGSPLVQVDAPEGATVAAKLESANPGGSAKDRPALWMIRAAERAGELEPGDRIVEPTSGNTGIGLSLVAAARGYDISIVMPASKSKERRQLMRAYGAEIELVDGDISAARERAEAIAEEGAVLLEQFRNPANPQSHYESTGPEILDQVEGREIDAFVAGVGTGGTITGVGRRLREAFPDVEIVAVEPADNAVLSGDPAGDDAFQGMGPGFVSENLDVDLLDDVVTVELEAAEAECRRLAREEGILVGQSSGAASLAARQVAERIAEPSLECPPAGARSADQAVGDGTRSDGGASNSNGANGATDATNARDAKRDPDAAHETDAYDDCPLVVTIFPDSGERYLSAGVFE
ncbi:cysteine synthase [Salinarchaeum sp. Harcht-Bsk1]|uniref:PLP-dependent cysteine synthase family protein n=1 Tax=Salinarchaeum sp. Harcht-Bsk1 TaxID=1333523 RepID=UPI0003422E52|nr:PLP-dependent cysteine synthase family protein [Salinarchaeum sp. Harcht-Bsk1]AGN01777.1 cysteine synthase [Salinarchaeum sp. Harcht-Bsk1]